MAVQKTNRPRVVRISVTLEHTDGTTRTIDVDPTRYNAMFWDDASVLGILGEFYEGKQRTMSRSDCELAFGKDRASAIFGQQSTLTLDRRLIEKLWNTPDAKGEYIGIMFKDHKCIPGG